MNGLGPLVDRLVATTTPEGLILITAGPPGPAGLAHTTIGDGALVLEVDVAEPDNLVGLRFSVDRGGLQSDALEWALRALLDGRGLDRLQRLLDGDRLDLGPDDEVVLWEGEPRPVLLDPFSIAERTERTGGLERLGRLALRTSELTRTERSSLGTALGLLDLADVARDLYKQFQPVPRSDALTDAGFGHLRRWAADPADDWWIEDVPARHRQQLIDQIEAIARGVRMSDRPLAERLRQLADTLRDMDWEETSGAADHPSRHGGEALPASLSEPSPSPLRAAMGPRSVHAVGLQTAGDLADSAVADAARSSGDTPVVVVVDPALVGIERAHGVVADGHVHVDGTGWVDGDAWVRVFRADPEPVMVAMAPLRVSRIGAWMARALLPADAPVDQLRVDLTATPRDPWRSPGLRLTVDAVDIGAAAARATRRADADAAEQWDRTAHAWAIAGDTDRARAAERLAETAADQTRTRPRTRPTPRLNRGSAPDGTGPLTVDLVE